MAATVPQPDRRSLLLRSEIRTSRMVKANLRKAETSDVRAKVGAAIERARCLKGWTLDELSGHVQRDSRQGGPLDQR